MIGWLFRWLWVGLLERLGFYGWPETVLYRGFRS